MKVLYTFVKKILSSYPPISDCSRKYPVYSTDFGLIQYSRRKKIW